MFKKNLENYGKNGGIEYGSTQNDQELAKAYIFQTRLWDMKVLYYLISTMGNSIIETHYLTNFTNNIFIKKNRSLQSITTPRYYCNVIISNVEDIRIY